MRQETESLLKRLEEADWLSAIGEPLPESARHSVIRVISWEEAIDCCSSIEWENFTLEQQNLLTMHLHHHARREYQNWNTIVESVKQKLEPLVAEKLAVAATKTGFPSIYDRIVNSVKWDMLGVCMELEYCEYRQPSFFCGVVQWYLAGRFPCGWGERKRSGEIELIGPTEDTDIFTQEADWPSLLQAEIDRVYNPKVRLPERGKLLVF